MIARKVKIARKGKKAEERERERLRELRKRMGK